MEIGDAPSPHAVIASVPITKTPSTSQSPVKLDNAKNKPAPLISTQIYSRDSENKSRVSPEKHEPKVELAPKKSTDDDKEEGEIDSNYEEESLYGPVSGHSSSKDKGRWFERYSIDSNSQHLDYSIPTVVPSKRSYDQYIPDYSNDRNRNINQERRRRNSSRERFIRNNLTTERSRSRSRGRSPSSQQRSRDRDYGRSRNYDSVRSRDRESIQIYSRDSSRSHDRDISRIHDRSTTRDNVFRSNDREVIRSGRDIYKETDKRSEVSEIRDYWTTEFDKKFDGLKNEVLPRDHAKYRKKSQLNKDSSKSQLIKSVNESKGRVQNDINMKFENKDHVSKYGTGLSEDRSALDSNSKKSVQKVISSSKVDKVNRQTKPKSYPSKPQPSSKPSRKPDISDWDYSDSSEDEADKVQKRKKVQDTKRKPLTKNITSTSTKIEDNKKVDNYEKKHNQNQAPQQKKLPQKQVSKINVQSASESSAKSKVVRKSKNVDTTSAKETDTAIYESNIKTKVVRKQTSNLKTSLEASGPSQDVMKQKGRKLKGDNITNDPNNSETSDSDSQSRYKSHLYDVSDDVEYIDRDYLTSGDEITDAYDLDMVRLYFELNDKGLLGSDGEPVEWSENEEEFTIRVGGKYYNNKIDK
jgi:hypothetical protein